MSARALSATSDAGMSDPSRRPDVEPTGGRPITTESSAAGIESRTGTRFVRWGQAAARRGLHLVAAVSSTAMPPFGARLLCFAGCGGV